MNPGTQPDSLEAPSAGLLTPTAFLAYALLATVVLMTEGRPVPFQNEQVYLLAPFRLFHPDFLAYEWSFLEPQLEHLPFDVLSGALMTLLPLETVGWIIRLVSWSAILAAFVAIAGKMGIRPWISVVGLAIWILNGQTTVGGEWLIRGAEAKAVAYPFLLWGIAALFYSRGYIAAILIGLGIAFHPVVGLQLGGAACFAAFLVFRKSWNLWVFCGLVVLCSLPGIIPSAMVSGGLSNSDWEFLALVRMPFHIDPLDFPKRDLLSLAVFLGFNALFSWFFWSNRFVRFFAFFQGILALFFAAGVVARLAGWFILLQVMPFRVLPALAPLLFLFYLGMMLRKDAGPLRPVLLAAGAWGLLCLEEPVRKVIDEVNSQAISETSEISEALAWLSTGSDPSAVILSPPWAGDAFSASHRAQVANWKFLRFGQYDEWRGRLEAVVGPIHTRSDALAAAQRERYATLTLGQVRDIRDQFGATHFLSEVAYDLPVLYEAGEWRVYSLEEG